MKKTNFVVDILIFLGFLAASVPALTGLAIHEWLSLALAGAVLVHLVLHVDWIWAVLGKFFKKLWQTSRLNFVVDLVTLIAYIGVMLSGILISREMLAALGIQLAENRTWESIHRLTADASIWLTALHFALHWRWIMNAVKRFIVEPVKGWLKPRRLPQMPPMETVKVEVTREHHR